MEMLTVKRVQRPFVPLGIICLFIGVMPYWQHVTIRGLPDGTTESRNVFTLGVPPSPLFHLEQSHTEQVRDTGMSTSHSWSFKLELVSWSTLALMLAALFFVANRSWGRSPDSIPGESLNVQPPDGKA
jgi:hypothetical protein